jgi:hypothetical protein
MLLGQRTCRTYLNADEHHKAEVERPPDAIAQFIAIEKVFFVFGLKTGLGGEF